MKENKDSIPEYIIDLTNSKRGAVAIAKQWNITVKEPNLNCFFRKFGLKITKHINLSIRNIKYPESLKIKGKLISILYNAREEYYGTDENENKDLEILIDSLNVPFQLFLNTASIIDCSEKQQRPVKSYEISFVLCATDKKKKDIFKENVKLLVAFKDIKSEPHVHFDFKKSSLTYSSSLSTVDMCDLVFDNDNSLEYYPDLVCDAEFKVLDKYTGEEKRDCIYIKNIEELHNLKLAQGDSKKFKIFANIPLIGNPIEREQHEFTLKAIVKYHYKEQENPVFQLTDVVGTFKVCRNNTKPQLGVFIEDSVTKKLIRNEAVYSTDEVDFSAKGPWGHFKNVIISNVANDGSEGSGIIIKDFNCKVEIKDVTTRLKLSQNKSLDAVFGIQPNFLFKDTFLQSDSSVTLPLGFEESKVLSLISMFGNKKVYETTLYYEISFAYYELNHRLSVNNLPDTQKQLFHFTVEMPIFETPSTNWLGIDFGTSAIVCRYGFNEINLHEAKKNYFRGDKDLYEEGTPYLSSNVILNYNRPKTENESELLRDYKDDKMPDLNNLAVMLSPTSSKEDHNMNYILPCVKMLVGYRYLPNIKKYEGFKYHQLSNEGENIEEKQIFVVDDDNEIIYSDLGNVDTVFCEVYKQLFSYYVRKKVDNITDLNNIVVTTPNTFSPNHFTQLEKLINDSFKDYNIRNLKFISESDAVACFYMNNWTDINEDRTNEERQRLIEGEENILVFDMGAGTLDITFMSRSQNNFTVKGRLGISKAGNYLDGLIAKILSKTQTKLDKIVDPNKLTNVDRLSMARVLKRIISSELKPAISENKSITLRKSDFADVGMGSDVEIPADLILDDKAFKEFINECTFKLLNNFFKFFELFNSNNIVEVDTMLVSGRSTKLLQIQEGLDGAMSRLAKPGFKRIDMSSVKLHGSKVLDKSKSVVVDGAMVYATRNDINIYSENIMANYGVIFYDSFGNIQYKELLNPRKEKPLSHKNFRGMNISTYRTNDEIINLAGCDNQIEDKKLKLVQSYSSNTLEDWRTGNHEYITVMSSYDIPGYVDRTKVALHIEVDEYNAMRLYMNGAVTSDMAPALIDVNSELNKKSLWPIIK